jgi:spore maturation protein CgeB
LRWLAVAPGPAFSVWDCHVGWMEALRAAGEQVIEFPLGDVLTFYTAIHLDRDDGKGMVPALPDNSLVVQMATDRVAAALFKIRPHVLFVTSGFFADIAVFDQARRLGTRIVLLHTESPYEDDRQLSLAPHADLNLINDPVQLKRFEDVAPTVYSPHAYRASVHRPGPALPEYACDLTFVGTGYPSRVAFWERLSVRLGGLTFKLGGNWMRLPDGHPLRHYIAHPIEECLDNEDSRDLYRSAKIGINTYRREAEREDCPDGVAIGPREVEMAATGLFFLRQPRPEGDEVWPMLPTFDDPEEAGDLARWWADHPLQREALAEAAREAIADRSFDYHVRQLLGLLGQA